MRKLISAILLASTLFLLCACDFNSVSSLDIDDPVTSEQLNTDGAYVARGFFESIFNENEDLFYRCFPADYAESLKNSDTDLFQQYVNAMQSDSTFLGTKYRSYNIVSVDAGYDDEESIRENIATFQQQDVEDVGEMQIIKLDVYFRTGGENYNTTIYVMVYEMDGMWYFYELQNSDAEFEN